LTLFRFGAIPLLLLFAHHAHAQSFSTLSGGRSRGLANSSSCLEDEWSLFNNVAGLGTLTLPSVAMSSHVRPQLRGTNQVAAALTMPVKIGVTAWGIMCTGDNLYREEIATAGFSNKFGIASLGVKVNYIQYNAEGFGRKGVTSISAGGIVSLTQNIKIGAHIINVNQPVISKTEDERLPTILVTGVSFTASEQLVILTEVEKNLDYDATWKTAMEYTPLKKLAVRSGFNLYPNAFFFGVGFSTRKFKFSYACEYSIAVGTGHEASVGYYLR
jgi:hypothetical protein